MKIDCLYQTVFGRMLMKMMQGLGVFRLIAYLLHTRISRMWIPHYIKEHHIDMQPFEHQKYNSFAEFFARSKTTMEYVIDSNMLISPCDGLLSVYPIDENMRISMKGSSYRLQDLVPQPQISKMFRNGLCLVFRLQASDYHHFCCIDDGFLSGMYYVPGQLHSVQPIACESVPVYRLNRRWWGLYETKHFGEIVQIEVGAMAVGKVHFEKERGMCIRGDEMGHFELAGSTIILLLNADMKKQLKLFEKYRKTRYGKCEMSVIMGEAIGSIK